jgi:hypothetical protein
MYTSICFLKCFEYKKYFQKIKHSPQNASSLDMPTWLNLTNVTYSSTLPTTSARQAQRLHVTSVLEELPDNKKHPWATYRLLRHKVGLCQTALNLGN